MNRTSSAAASAMIDQADAATAEAARVMAAVADQMGGALAVKAPTGPTTKILRRLADRALRGDLGHCEHLNGGPRPSVWLAWRPSRLRCWPCAGQASSATRGTTEDAVCDACRRHTGGRIYSGATLLPAVVADLPGLLTGTGPVVVTFGLCRRCHRAAGLDGVAQ